MRDGTISVLGLGVLAATVILASGCSDTGSMVGASSRTGQVRLVLSAGAAPAATSGVASSTTLNDDEGRHIESAAIALSSVLARNLDGELIDVAVDLPVTVDLIGLIQGGTVELPMGSLPAGSYDQFVIVIRSLHVGLSDGTQIEVTPPGGGWTAVVPTEPFEIVEGSVTTVQLRFRAEGAFRWLDGRLDFHPEFDGDVDDDHNDGDDD